MKAKIIIEVGDDSTEIEMTGSTFDLVKGCLLYTSDAADE